LVKAYNKRLNSDNVSLSWFWQTTQKATPTHCVLGGRYATKESFVFKLIPLLFIFLITSCASTTPVINSSSPISIYGVTAWPPKSVSWAVMLATGYQYTIGSKGSNTHETTIINVSTFKLPDLKSDVEFLDYILKSRAATPVTGRFDNKKNSESLVPLNGATCVKYSSLSVDKNAKTAEGNTTMFLESIGYNCQHPNNKSVGVNIEYSSRYFSATDESQLESKSAELFSSVKFKEF